MEREALRHRRLTGRAARPPVEIGFYGGDLWQLPRGPRTALLDAAEREVRRGRAFAIRITLAPLSVLRAPLLEFRARGVRTVEIPVHTLDPRELRLLGVHARPRLALDAVGRLHRARLRSVVHLSPGLPGGSHGSALASAAAILRARPHGARILPALALEGTRLGALFRAGLWQPMDVPEAVATTRHLLDLLLPAGTEVVRVGLHPQVDLRERSPVLAGPQDPDLRLLAESESMRSVALRALTGAFSFGTRAFTFAVHPGDEAWLRGPENETLQDLARQFRLERIRVVAVPEQPRRQLRAFPGELDAAAIPPLRLPRARKAS
jgi:hypothetical protein